MTDKPKHLYHGSCAGIDGDLTPRPQHGDANGLFEDGPQDLVFATDNKDMVMGYTLKTKHMCSVMPHEDTHLFLFMNHDGWQEEISRSECAIYTLPSDTFEPTLQDGKTCGEWKSREAVTPVGKERVTSEKVMETGGQMLFLAPEIDRPLWDEYMERIREHPPIEGTTGAHFMRELQDHGLMDRHLNEETGINPVELPKSEPLSEQIADDVAWLKQQVEERRGTGRGPAPSSPPPPPALSAAQEKTSVSPLPESIRQQIAAVAKELQAAIHTPPPPPPPPSPDDRGPAPQPRAARKRA